MKCRVKRKEYLPADPVPALRMGPLCAPTRQPLHTVCLGRCDFRAVGEGCEIPEVPSSCDDNEGSSDDLGSPTLDEVVEEQRAQHDRKEQRWHVVINEAHSVG